MAWDPCVSCGRDFHGPTEFSYFTWHRGETRYAYRLRQCTECSSSLRNGVVLVADVRNEDGGWDPLQERRPSVTPAVTHGDRAEQRNGVPKSPPSSTRAGS